MAPPPPPPLTERNVMQFFSVMAESMLVGAYAVLIAFVIWILVMHHRTLSKTYRILFGASMTMFVISFAHLALLLQEATHGDFPTPGVGKTLIVLSTFQFVIGDLILIWRVWLLWGRNYFIVAGPFIMMVIAAGFTLRNASHRVIQKFFSLVPVSLIVANTTICTLLIIGRVWFLTLKVQRATRSSISLLPAGKYRAAVALIVESGALYTTCQLLSLILDHIQSPGVSVMLNLEMPLIGILPTLIIVLVYFDLVPGTQATKKYAAYTSQDTNNIHLDTIHSRTMMTRDGFALKSSATNAELYAKSG